MAAATQTTRDLGQQRHHYPTLFEKCLGYFTSPECHYRRLDQRFNVPVPGWCDERSSNKVHPQSGPELKPGHLSWQSEISLCYPLTNTVHTQYISDDSNISVFPHRQTILCSTMG